MRLISKILTLCLLAFFVSCSTTKKLLGIKKKEKTETTVAGASGETETRRPGAVGGEKPGAKKSYPDKVSAYVGTYAPLAQEEMRLYKVPASITLAQGILESGAGNSELTRKANNHFGIKCHGWEGGKVYHDDDRAQECFRKYNDPKYSFRDHSLFLSERKRYAKLFELDPDDYRGWARGLRAAGYATDRRYPDKLIDLIERYDLHRYDAAVLGHEAIAYEDNLGLSQTYVVKKGDTLYDIGKRYNLSVEQLKQLNGLSGTVISVGQLLYVGL